MRFKGDPADHAGRDGTVLEVPQIPMQQRLRTPKRLGRIALSRLPIRTKRDLAVATWFARDATASPEHDLHVRLGAFRLTLAAATFYIDYCTLYGVIVDNRLASRFRAAQVIDIGAHKGYYGAFALHSGAAHVWSFEPASQNYLHLERSAAGSPTWIVDQRAVGCTAGEGVLNMASAY